MSKSDAPLSRIDLERAYAEQTKPEFSGSRMINAFDTETHKGNVFMLSYALGDFNSCITCNPNSIESLDSHKIFNMLTHRNCRSAINCWFNLDFDANAILSDILNTRQLTQLSISNETTCEIDGIEYEIKYVKGKFMLIKDSNNHNYPHYDISQFFYSSLDEASQEWLGERKKEDIDTTQFDNEEYLKEHFFDIKEYARKDAKLTQELAYALIKEAENLNIPMGKPFSTGYLSAEYLRENMEKKPSFGNREYQSMFWKSYYGGRFEVFKRGNVGEVVAPDINSAYPAVMQQLPDPSTMDWEKYSNIPTENEKFGFAEQNFDFEDIENADYGVIRATVTTKPDNPIQPFAQKINGKVHFPALTASEITVIKPIFEFAVKNDMLIDYDLLEGWLANTTENTEYPFEFLGDMYGQRKWFEHPINQKYKKGKLLKIVLNSAYGKTCQNTEFKYIWELDENEERDLEDNQKVYPRQYLSLNQRDYLKDNEVIISELRCGRRFNPFIASYITGLIRLELHQQVVNYGLVEDTVMFATDCIMVKKDAYEDSNFEELIKTPDTDIEDKETFVEQAKESLGSWDFDYEGNGFVVGSGVYEVDKPDGSQYTKTRGFTERELDKTLKDLAKENPNGIPITNNRPLTISEVLISPEKGNVSQFIEHGKILKPDFDEKRNWYIKNVDFHDLLSNEYGSDPISLSEEQAELLRKAQENVETEDTVKSV